MPCRPLTLAAAGLIALLPLAAHAQRVEGEPLRIENAKRGPAEAFRAAGAPVAATLRFQPLGAERLATLQRHNEEQGKRLQIGIGRNVADEAAEFLPHGLEWLPAAGGHVLRIDVVSPGAAALRVGIDPRNLPEGVELRVASPALAGVYLADGAATRAGVDAGGVFWTAVTEGERQQIELFVPTGTDLRGAAPRVRAISHLVSSPLRPLDLRKALGSSGACNIDVVCRTGTLGQAFVNAKNAVARMVYTSGTGSFTCTGTLLNDSTPTTQVPYFYSAAHCISQQTEASTLTTFWNYETPTCGVRNSGPNTQVSGGADLLSANLNSDALLLRLRSAPPAGAYLSGWNASTLTAPTAVVAIHHPSGDNKKYSRGSHSGFSNRNTASGTGSFARASWAEATTEGGSSGSGLFVLENNEYLLRGGLYGGPASCATTGQSEAAGNVDYYSRFDQVYPSLQQWLGTAAGPTRDYTGAWFVPTESGWGLTVFNFPGQMFALFFVYDTAGRPAWYRMQGAWTGTDAITTRLDRPTGPVWANSFNPNNVSYTTVGNATLNFTSATSATLTFNDGTVSRTVTLSKI